MQNTFFSNKKSNIELKQQANFKERHKDDYYMKNNVAKLWDTFKPAIILGLVVFCIF